MPDPNGRTWQVRLRDVLLVRIGHSRRFAAEMRLDDGLRLVSYSFETGFDAGRFSHSWRLVVAETSDDPGRAVVTRQPWLAAMAQGSMRREIRPAEPETAAGEDALIAVVEDEDAWRARLEGELGRWFVQQPAERSWEILPGLIVGHEPLEAAPETGSESKSAPARSESLAAAARELRERLSPAAAGAQSESVDASVAASVVG